MKADYKYLLITAFALLFFSRIHAQISGGVEAEFNTSSVKISDINSSYIRNTINGSNIRGYEFGFYLKGQLGNIYIKPKALASFQSGMVFVNYNDEHSADVSVVVTKLDLPVLIGVKVLGPLSVEAGPVYNRIVTATSDFNGNHVDIRPNGLGYRIGANLQLGILGFPAHWDPKLRIPRGQVVAAASIVSPKY